jgi:DNA-binding transcriptional MerR regulator
LLTPGAGSRRMAGEYRVAAAADIPDKLYFRIGEVSRLVGVKQYVLRYWETEFPWLAPKKSGRNHRLYRRKDVELVLEIKRLLYEKRYTIEGARNLLDPRSKPAESSLRQNSRKRSGAASQPANQGALFQAPAPEALAVIRKELLEILALLK